MPTHQEDLKAKFDAKLSALTGADWDKLAEVQKLFHEAIDAGVKTCLREAKDAVDGLSNEKVTKHAVLAAIKKRESEVGGE